MDYNTSRKKLVLPEYGRNIQNMVDHIKSVEDKAGRNKLAIALIQIMGNMNPHLRDINDFKHKLWDHLAIMANFELDIDYPYDVPAPETFTSKPRIVGYNTGRIRYKHYGKTIELLIKEAIELPDSVEKNKLVEVIANHMKKSYLTWNKDSVDDDVIYNDLFEISNGKLKLSDDFKLAETKDILGRGKRKKIVKRR